MAPSDSIQISALLLAGGQGSRLGGRDKGLMRWEGKPVAAYLAAVARQLADEVLISCNRNQDEYREWADKLVGDAEPGYPGPLAGVLAGLGVCNGTHLLVLPCDMPQIDVALLRQLCEQALIQPDRPCLVRAGEQWQPLLTVIPRALLPALEAVWHQGQRSPLRWLLGQPHAILQLAASDTRLRNANTSEDWEVGG